MIDSSTSEPTPIFVVGMNRSGTKWLSNELSRHSRIASVKMEGHTGILETNMLHTMERKFDLSSADDYVGLVELWSQSDFFRQTGAETRLLYDHRPRPTSTTELFGILMDHCARRQRCSHWLQKTSPLIALKLAEAFPHARYVLVRRKLLGNVRSRVKHSRAVKGDASLLRAVGLYVVEAKALTRLIGHQSAVEVRYENMQQDLARTLGPVWEHLGLEPPEGKGDGREWRRNSSFSDDRERSEVFTLSQEVLVRAAASVLSIVPFDVLRVARRCAARRAPPLVRGTFSKIQSEYDFGDT